MDETNDVLTPEEVAAFLRTDSPNVRQLLEDGDLAGFKIAGEWRVLSIALVEFLRRKTEASQQEALSRALLDPRRWAREVRRHPDQVAYLNEHEFEDGTMGAWLKDALRAEEQERTADNVVPLRDQRPE